MLFSLSKIRMSQPPMARHQRRSAREPAPVPTKSDCAVCPCPGTGSGRPSWGEERPGLPRARHSRAQPAPADPTAGHSRAPRPQWWHLWENVFNKGQNAARQWGVRKNVRETALEHQSERRRRGGGAPETLLQPVDMTAVEPLSTSQLMADPTPQLVGISWRNWEPMLEQAPDKNHSPWEGPTLEQVCRKGLHPCWSREKVWGGRSCREELLRTYHNPRSPFPWASQEGRRSRSWEWRSEAEPGKKWAGWRCFSSGLFFLTIELYF